MRMCGLGRVTRIGLGAALGAGTLAVSVAVAPAPSRAAAAFGAVAAASGVATSAQDPTTIPLGAVIEADGPIAQAGLTSAGQSTGFAALPYPGSFALSVPGLLASQGAPELPPYPLYVESSAGLRDKDEVTQPGLSLTAHSSPDSSTASGAAGQRSEQASVASSTATATVSVDHTAGAVLASSGDDTELLTTGPLHIGRVLSRAQATRSGSAGLRRSSSLEVADVTVNGATVGLSDRGFTAGSATAPVPANPVATQLAQAGIAVTYLAAHELPDGVLSPGLRIDIAPPQGGLHTTLTVGQSLAVASGDAAALPGLGFGGGLLGAGALVGNGLGRVPGGAGVSTTAGTIAGSAGPVSPPSAPGGEGTAGASTPTAGPATPPALAAGVRPPGPAPGSRFYLLLVAGAVLALVAGQLISVVGVRWGSSS
jgi:hypothetical protein